MRYALGARTADVVVYIPLLIARSTSDTRSCQRPLTQRLNHYKMAPRNKLANISFTVDSASEDELTHDELSAMPTPDSNTENRVPARKAHGKAAQSAKTAAGTKAIAKSRSTTRVVENKDSTAAKKVPTKAGRKVLAERKRSTVSDEEQADELEEDDLMEAAEPTKPAKRGRQTKARKAQEKEVEEVEEEEQEELVEEEPAPVKRGRRTVVKEPVVRKETKAKTTKSRTTKRNADTAVEPEAFTIPETQPEQNMDPMDIESSTEIEGIPESMPPPPRPSARRTAAASRTQQPSAGVRRAGSVSDTERDPAVRRKVVDLTKKLEAMTAKYEALKDVAISGKDSNLEQLRKRTEQASKGTHKLFPRKHHD